MYLRLLLNTVIMFAISFGESKPVAGQYSTMELSSKYEAVQIILTNDVALELELSSDQKKAIVSILRPENKKFDENGYDFKRSSRMSEAETVDAVNRLQEKVGASFDAISECLLPEQRIRLEQIIAQRAARFGPDMLFGIKSEKLNLDLSNDQIAKVEETAKSLSTAFAQDFRNSYHDFKSLIISACNQQLKNLSDHQRAMYESSFGEPFVTEGDAIRRMELALSKVKMRLPYPEPGSKFTWAQFSKEESDLSLNSNAFGLLIQPGVAEQLELSDDQLAQASVAVALYREMLRKANDNSSEQSAVPSGADFDLEQLNLMLPFQCQTIREMHRQREISMMQDSYFGLKSCVEFLEITREQMKNIDLTADEIDKQLAESCSEIRTALEEKLTMYQAKQVSNLTPKQRHAYESFFGKLFLGSNLIHETPHPKFLKQRDFRN